MAKIPIVDIDDNIIGYKERDLIKLNDLHRVTCLWITDINGNVLLAQRALSKKRHGGKWSAAVAGAVEEGETYMSNIIKEAEEELGLKGFEFVEGPKALVHTKDYSFWGQEFFLELPLGYNNFILEDSVAQTKWFTLEEVKNMFEKDPESFVPSFYMTLEIALKYYETQN